MFQYDININKQSLYIVKQLIVSTRNKGSNEESIHYVTMKWKDLKLKYTVEIFKINQRILPEAELSLF